MKTSGMGMRSPWNGSSGNKLQCPGRVELTEENYREWVTVLRGVIEAWKLA